MDANLRNAYLDALGIDRWVSRDAMVEVDAPRVEMRSTAPVATAATVARVAPPPSAPAPVTTPRAPLPAGIDWEPLRAAVAACTACDLCKTRTQTVFGVGNPRAEWLVIAIALCRRGASLHDDRRQWRLGRRAFTAPASIMC